MSWRIVVSKNIDGNNSKITKLMNEVDEYLKENTKLQEDLQNTTKRQEEVAGARQKLSKLNTLRGKISAESICYYERT